MEITELRLPSSSTHAPQVTLLRYKGPECLEAAVRWAPPVEEAGGSITLRGRKFGVSFTLAVAVSQLRLEGTLVAKWSPQREPDPRIELGFQTKPRLAFEVSLAGKALSLGSET